MKKYLSLFCGALAIVAAGFAFSVYTAEAHGPLTSEQHQGGQRSGMGASGSESGSDSGSDSDSDSGGQGGSEE